MLRIVVLVGLLVMVDFVAIARVLRVLANLENGNAFCFFNLCDFSDSQL